MFGFLYSTLPSKAKNRLLINGNSLITITIKTLCFNRNPFLVTSRSISHHGFSDNPTHPRTLSFTVSYLISSCGLSEAKAIAASKNVHFESSIKPDSVLNLLRSHKFNNTHISKIIEKFPSVLIANADKTLKPKLDFFNSSLGLSGPELAKHISMNPETLKYSLEDRIKPSIDFLKTLLSTQSQVISVIRRCSWLINNDIQKILPPNIALLRAHGVPDLNIFKLLLSDPRTLAFNARLDEVVKETKKLKLDPSEKAFTRAIEVLSGLSRSKLDTKFQIFKRWGWSEDEVHTMLRKSPKCLMLSENNIMATMEFIVHKMGYPPSLVIRNPILLTYSLEKRIIPRLSIIQVLLASGFVERDCSISAVITLTDEKFLKKFVTKYEERFPLLLKTYKAKMGCFESAYNIRNEGVVIASDL